jgi:hypothetical protein
MRDAHLQDTIRRGIGRAAAVAGAWCDAYRPAGATDPLAPGNRFLRLPAIFSPPSGLGQPAGYGAATWTGLFDSAMTRPGDYIVRTDGAGERETWFIAAQQYLLPVLCVRVTRVVAFHRAAAPSGIGANPYGGVLRGTATQLAAGWPASVLNGGGAGLDLADLPADAAPAVWSVLLPPIDRVQFRNGDLMTDDLGRTGIVAAAERTDLGWRLQVKQATT